jgi:hypothetical protein
MGSSTTKELSMHRPFTAKCLIAAAIALSAAAATSVMAQSRYDERRSIAVGEPYGHQQPGPRHDHRDRRGGPFGDADRDGIPNRFDRDSRFYDHREARRSAEWGDWARDGVVNRFDRFPRNPRRS